MMKKVRRLLLTTTVAIIVVITGTLNSPVNAVDHSTHFSSLYPAFGWTDPSVTWSYSQQGSKNFHGMVDAAAYAWTTSPTQIVMTEGSNWDLKIYSAGYGNTGWVGLTVPIPFTWCYINYLNESYSRTDSQWCEIAAHEMGHAHGLGHYACTQEIMRGDADFVGTYYPQTGDIAGVNYIYP